ncbi:MAG: BatA domain-containing protein, partial [Phycisphaerales bacterium]
MSFLYPLLLAGVAAIGLPILAHMIRSKARKRVEFSSLMFVPVTLPRFSKRSRIEHVLLLILRCAVFCLLAFAFSRPFFKQAPTENPTGLAKRTALLIDTSASMRRAGLWGGALGEARSVLKDAGPAD